MRHSGAARGIAVVVPAHNEARTIAGTIDAILAQTRPAAEVHIVCNACSDDTAGVARRYPVTVHTTARAGVSHARNLGARAARAELLLFVDADVTLPQQLLATIGAVTRNARTPVGTVRVRPDRRRYTLAYHAAALLIPLARAASNGLIFCSRDAFLGAGGFPEEMHVGEDNVFMRSARRQAGARYHFLRHPSAISSTRRIQRWGTAKLLMTWIRGTTAIDKRSIQYEAVR